MTRRRAVPAAPAAVTRLVAERTAGWDRPARAALDAMVHALRPSVRHLHDVLDWIDDVVVRDGTTPGAVLGDPELAAVVGAAGAASERLKRWKARLRRLRYPRLSARAEAVATAVRDLGLGPRIAIEVPRDLEGGTVTVTLTAGTIAELRAAAALLQDRLLRGELERIFELLRGG